ncbi:MAG: TonB-dependent receptor plug domain-containing protein [Flavobacteriales bacterium]
MLQALRNLPGVTVDQRNGKLQLRGSDKVAVLVDGQQSALTGFGDQSGLDNIPASAIERSRRQDPSAKQDANGMAGSSTSSTRRTGARAPWQGIHDGGPWCWG